MSSALAALDEVDAAVARAVDHVRDAGGPDEAQQVAYDVAHVAAGAFTARSALAAAPDGDGRALAEAFTGDVAADLVTRAAGRTGAWGPLPDLGAFLERVRDPAWLASLADAQPPVGLDADYQLVADTFGRFARERIAPVAARVHRENADIPEELVGGLAELGAFGLSVPAEYGGFATGGERDYLGMVVATEELSRASLGAGGSLITRPEILTRALVKGGSEEQKRRWLPRLADGSTMVAVAVTEPDHGSDVAGLTTAAVADGDDWVVTGTKTWSTFAARADVLMLLARTDPDRSLGHRGLSLFVVEKPLAAGGGFVLDQPGGGRLEGRPIDTIGYRGMHSYELSFQGWRVPGANLVGEPGRGFYLQMEGFENGRLQTAARAVGVMQAALDEARSYAATRTVFGRAVAGYQLTQVKLARMAAAVAAGRAATYQVAKLMGAGGGALEASMVKASVCRAAEWVTREALQVHGGYGYAEEYPVSRLFVDARVLSIFEGADETLALKVIARKLVA